MKGVKYVYATKILDIFKEKKCYFYSGEKQYRNSHLKKKYLYICVRVSYVF